MIPSFVPEDDTFSNSAMIVERDDSIDEAVEECVYPASPEFQVGQSVLFCDASNDGGHTEGVIRKVKRLSSETNEWSFLVQHRGGMNSKWERWVSKNDILPNDTTCETRMTANSTNKKRKQESHDSSSLPMTLSSPVSRRRRKYSGKNTSTTTMTTHSVEVQDEYCELPVTLRNILTDESAYITKKGLQNASDCAASPRPLRRLHTLPATVTVKQLLQHFEKKGSDSHGGDEVRRVQVQQFCDELANLFDNVLPDGLLYPEEIPQYKSTLRRINTSRPCEVYGCNFLLRLVVRMPHLLHSGPVKKLQSPILADLIVLLQKNRQVCFRHSYREPTYEELLDWEKALVDDDPEFGCTTIAAATVEPDEEDNDDMAITPSKKTQAHSPY